MRQIKKWGLFFMLTAVVWLSPGCQSHPAQQKLTLLLDWLPNPDHIPLFVGLEKGFFVEEGIHLEVLKLVDPPSAIPYLQSKKTDIVLYYMPYALMAAEREKGLKVLGILIQEPLDGIMFLQTPSKQSIQDLHGKTLGVCPGAKIGLYIQEMLKSKGIAFSEIRKIEIDPSLALYSEMVDAIAGVYWNVEPFQIESLGTKTHFVKVTELGVPSYHELIFLTREDVLREDPSLRERFQKALQKSIQYCKEYPHEAFTLYLKANPDKTGKTQEWERDSWTATIPVLAQSQILDPIIFKTYVQWMFEHHLLEKDIEVEPLLH